MVGVTGSSPVLPTTATPSLSLAFVNLTSGGYRFGFGGDQFGDTVCHQGSMPTAKV